MRMRYRGFVHRFLSGILIGIGCILPGVSGGVMAISFGLYRPALDALLTFFHDTAKKLRYLLPIALGGCIGLLIGARALTQLIAHSGDLMLFLFIGFILGGLPDLWRESSAPIGRRMGWIITGAALTLPFALLGAADASAAQLTPVQAFLTGLLEGAGTIIPGVSAYLQMLWTMLMPQLIWMGVGFSLSALVCMHAVQSFFDRRPAAAYSMVTGFVLSSVMLIFPGFAAFPRCFAQIGLAIIGISLVQWLNNINIPKR